LRGTQMQIKALRDNNIWRGMKGLEKARRTRLLNFADGFRKWASSTEPDCEIISFAAINH
jgi:hypothetical protein